MGGGVSALPLPLGGATALLLKEGIRKVLENELPSSKDGITPEGKTLH